MRIYLIRFFILCLITSFTASIVVGCGGRQRRQTRRLESRVDSLEKNWGTTEKRVVDRIDSMEKRVTERLGAMDTKTIDLETLKQITETLELLEQRIESLETMEKDMDAMEKEMDDLEREMDAMEKYMDDLGKDMDSPEKEQ